MELSLDDIELLDRFFRNELAVDELAELQKRMKDPDFAASAKVHLESLEVVKNAGRSELRSVLTSIQNEIQKTDGYQEYKPSSSGKKPNSGNGFFTGLIIVIVAVSTYFYFTGKIKPESIENVFPSEQKIDTVYHYSIKRDTVYKTIYDTVRTRSTHRISSDTIYERQNLPVQSK